MQIGRFPHPQAKDIMVVGRLVVLPEYQGFGIGTKFLDEIARLYKNDRIRITTSLKPFIMSLQKNSNWACVRFGRVGKPGKKSAIHNIKKDCAVSYNRITATFQYKR